MEAIKTGSKNNYATVEGKKTVLGYHGIDASEWEIEWQTLLKQFNIAYSMRLQLDISLCVCSLIQDTLYERENVSGRVDLFVGNDGYIIVSTEEKSPNHGTVIFAKFGPYCLDNNFRESQFQKCTDEMIPILESVETYREGEKLHLKMDNGKNII